MTTQTTTGGSTFTPTHPSERGAGVGRQIGALVRRNLSHIKRQPEMLTDVTIQPVMFVLLFAYVFGGSITVPGVDYKEWLLPGIMAQTMTFSAFIVAIGLNTDIGKGIVDTLSTSRSPAVLMRNHGPFAIGKDAKSAVKAAVMLEDVARTVHIAREAGPLIPIPQDKIDALYNRYQNVYGQSTDDRR